MIEATEEFAFFCFDVLSAHLASGAAPKAAASIPDDDACVFVTWTRKGKLAGCKGITGGARPLRGLLEYFAIDAATNDSRFRPLKSRDIGSDLACGVSVLHSFEPARTAFDWRIGVHGIKIDFTVAKKRMSATYLPHVAPEQGWNIRETLESLVRKAGFDGEVDDALLQSIRCERYQAAKIEASHDEWKAARSPATQ